MKTGLLRIDTNNLPPGITYELKRCRLKNKDGKTIALDAGGGTDGTVRWADFYPYRAKQFKRLGIQFKIV